MKNADKKTGIINKIFYIILTLLVLGSVGVTFVKIVIQKNYQIVGETSCNPKIEKCFVYTCDPIDDKTCPTEETEQTTYYKKVSKNAANIALCETTEDRIGCDTELSCINGETSCFYTFCDPGNLDQGETCTE